MSGADGDDRNYAHLPLGRDTLYPETYDPDLLCAIPRVDSRRELGISDDALPFCGEDIWNAYELSWLDGAGKPRVALGEFRFPADTPSIIESKSFKLYLNSLNQTRFDTREQLQSRLCEDLSRVAGATVSVAICGLDDGASIVPMPGVCLDELEVSVSRYQVDPELLAPADPDRVVEEQLHSHLLRSLCPVTGQPDWASVLIHYRGPAIDRVGLLRYLLSYRQHREFHEQCVERIYMDIQQRYKPHFLQVYARYLRRGGLDINPCRSSEPLHWSNLRLARQ